ncbi:galactose-1-phosphate uridylyltransferase [Candidatus Harpocratesius sp.]
MEEEKFTTPQHRWDPLLKEWIIYAPRRNVRPFQGKQFDKKPKKTWDCPFCPNAPEGAGNWVVKQLPNRFAALDEHVPFEEQTIGSVHKQASNYGKCEVILYSQDHNASFGTLSHDNIVALIELWQERYRELSKLPEMKYPFIMENRGKEIGNSMAHPHGQIYSFPYFPPKIKKKWESFIEYNNDSKKCLLCDIVAEEMRDPKRVIEQNVDFIAEVPYYAHWAFEVHIIAKTHIPSIVEMNPSQVENLARIMKSIVNRYDALIGNNRLMPYVMAMFNAPVNTSQRDVWHFHIEFYTPFRGQGKWKFLAGVELGTYNFINDALPEKNALILRNVNISSLQKEAND